VSFVILDFFAGRIGVIAYGNRLGWVIRKMLGVNGECWKDAGQNDGNAEHNRQRVAKRPKSRKSPAGTIHGNMMLSPGATHIDLRQASGLPSGSHNSHRQS